MFSRIVWEVRKGRTIAITTLMMLCQPLILSPAAHATPPLCESPASDVGCQTGSDSTIKQQVVEAETYEPIPGTNGRLVCQSEYADPDGDGFGWENNNSCVVPGSTALIQTSRAPKPLCLTDDADPDGDGWGWENSASCKAAVTGDKDAESIDNTDTNTANIEPLTDTAIEATVYLPSDITDLILVTGQSNTLGANTSVDSSLDAPHPRVFAYTSKGWDVAALFQSWDNIAHPGTGDPADTLYMHNNFALHFGKQMAALDENAVIGFILVSEPGEGIDHWRPGNTGMLRVQQKTLEAINALPHKAAIDGILWHQGETDWILRGTSDPDVEQPAAANYYPLRLNNLIENFRQESWYDSDKPFICGETIQAVGVNTHLNSLNSDGDINTVCVAGADLAAISEDDFHFNAPSLRILGRRYAEAYDLLR